MQCTCPREGQLLRKQLEVAPTAKERPRKPTPQPAAGSLVLDVGFHLTLHERKAPCASHPDVSELPLRGVTSSVFFPPCCEGMTDKGNEHSAVPG